MNESVSDVVFVVEGQQIPAMKSILSLKSKVFRAMFSGKFKESEDKEVVIEDTTYEAFKTLVQFIYCERLVLNDDNDFKLIEEVCQLSDRYDLKRILEKVDDHLMATPLNCSDSVTFNWVSKIAFDHNLPNVKTRVLSQIDQNFKHFITKTNKQLIDLNVFTHNHFVEVLAQNYRKLSAELNKEYKRVNEELNSTKYKLYNAQAQLDDYEKRKCKYCYNIGPIPLHICNVCKKSIFD